MNGPRITVDYIVYKAILCSQSSNHNAICLHILPVPINNNKWAHALLRGIMWFVYNLAANKLFWHLGQCGLFNKSWLKQIILQNVSLKSQAKKYYTMCREVTHTHSMHTFRRIYSIYKWRWMSDNKVLHFQTIHCGDKLSTLFYMQMVYLSWVN